MCCAEREQIRAAHVGLFTSVHDGGGELGTRGLAYLRQRNRGAPLHYKAHILILAAGHTYVKRPSYVSYQHGTVTRAVAAACGLVIRAVTITCAARYLLQGVLNANVHLPAQQAFGMKKASLHARLSILTSEETVLQDGSKRIGLGHHARERTHVHALTTLVPVFDYGGSRKKSTKID